MANTFLAQVGSNMDRHAKLANIPAELKSLPHWICVDSHKRPVHHSANHLLEWKNVANHLTFEQATASLSLPHVAGVAFIFSDDDPFTIIDLDDPAKVEERALERNLPQAQAVMMRKQTINSHRTILENFKGAYTEVSQSGNGMHILVRAGLPDNVNSITRARPFLGLEIYRAQHYVWMTGNTLAPHYKFDGYQDTLTSLALHLWQQFGKNEDNTNNVHVLPTTDGMRRLDLTDEQVAERLKARGNATARAYAGHGGFTGDWSDDTKTLVGELDKITGDPEQVYRVLFHSPRLQNAGFSNSSREDRARRTHRIFSTLMRQARESNEPYLARYEHGKAMAEILLSPTSPGSLAYKAVQIELENEKAAEFFQTPHDTKRSIFCDSVRGLHKTIRKAVPEFECRLTLPPGLSGEIVKELGQMVTTPRLEYLLPAYLFGLSSVFGRKFKDDGEPISLFILVTGKQFTGKTRAATAIKDAFANAIAYRDADPANHREIVSRVPDSHKIRQYITPIQFKSANELHYQLMMKNSYGALMDEAASATRTMLSDSEIGDALKTYIKLSWDSGKAYETITPQQSKAGRRENAQFPVYNPNLSIYATCTEDELERMSIDDLVNGFWSRWVVQYDSTPLGNESIAVEDLRHALSTPIAEHIRRWHSAANEVDAQYIPNQTGEGVENGEAREISHERLAEIEKGYLRNVRFATGSKELFERLGSVLVDTARSAQIDDDTVPKWFEIVVRARNMIRRVACLLAVAENFDNPVVTREQVLWAANYILYWQSVLLTQHDRGNVAITQDDAPAIICEKLYTMLKKNGEGVVLNAELYRACRAKLRALVRKGDGTSDLFDKTVARLIAEKLISFDEVALAGDTYAKKYIRPHLQHKFWLHMSRHGD